MKGLFEVHVSVWPTWSTRTQGGHAGSLSRQQLTDSVASEPNAGELALAPGPTTDSAGGAAIASRSPAAAAAAATVDATLTTAIATLRVAIATNPHSQRKAALAIYSEAPPARGAPRLDT